MTNYFDRRTFLRRFVYSGAGTMLGSWFPRWMEEKSPEGVRNYEICSVSGNQYFENTIRAVDGLGGMKNFVKNNATVGLLINSVFDHPGTVVHPDIPLAVIHMCLEAGASKIMTIENTPHSYWKRSKRAEKFSSTLTRLEHSDAKQEMKIPNGKLLKEAMISTTLLNADVFINIPIIKNHRGVMYTGTMKNMMGASSSLTNRRCHFGDQSIITTIFQGYYDKVDILAQSIADLNLVRSPDLCVMDATEILTTNGPDGPGIIKTPQQILAGTNALAIDMVGVKFLELDPQAMLVIKKAQEHNLGPTSLIQVKEIQPG
jgi:uncharacterized protein (DUF362 family)